MANKAPWLRWRFENANKGEADLYVYDVIGDPFFGTTAAEFIQDLKAAGNVSKINLYVKSEGGYVTDALEIYNALQQHPAEITAYIGSLAASAASFLVMAADNVLIARNARMVIHDAMSLALGNAEEMRRIAGELDEESANIADIYAERTKDDAATWRARMQANNGEGTSYRGEEAVNVGLADGLITASRNQFDRISALIDESDPALSSKPAVGDPEPIDDLTLALMPPLATAAAYRAPVPDLEGLLQKHPLKVGG